jgi:dGTP triphosphohydrolase
MSKLILCTGAYAEKPYYFEKAGKNIYSVEELCYVIIHNAFLIDTEAFDEKLCTWIYEECHLKKLSEELRSMIGRKCSAASMAGMILEYVKYGTISEINKTQEIIKNNANLDEFDKGMARADYLMKAGSYRLAIAEYDHLLANTADYDKKIRAKIEHNEGVMYAGLFQFEKAAEMFLKAYNDRENEESYLEYLAAKRLSMSERDYISFIGEYQEAHELSLKLEQRMDEANDLFASSENNHMLQTLSVYRSESNSSEYYDKVADIAADLKEEYREMVKEIQEKRS